MAKAEALKSKPRPGSLVRKRRPLDSDGFGPNEKALLLALAVGLVAGLFGMGFGSSYVELVRDYASCSSAERSYIASTSLAEAKHVLFVVDDLEDRHLRDGFNRVPPSRGAKCIAVPTEGPHLRSTCGKTGRCTLRAALEEAATIHRHTPVTMQLRGGLFRLAAPLPEVVGAVHMVGSEPSATAVAVVSGRGNGGVFRNTADPFSQIGVAPEELETVIDGNGNVQILRTDPFSRLHLQDLRLENGVALIRDKLDLRLALGGAINALGGLMLTNTVVRENRAINGGALYTEGDVEVHNSRLERNLAHQCGGALYAATGGKVHLAHSGIHNNHDRCGRRTSATDIPDSRDTLPGTAAKVEELAPPAKDTFRRHDSDHGLQGAVAPGAAHTQKHQTDVSGAIAEGPRLTGRRLADKPPLPSGVLDRTPEESGGLELADSQRRAPQDDKASTWSQRWSGRGKDAPEHSADAGGGGKDSWQSAELRALREAREAREARS